MTGTVTTEVFVLGGPVVVVIEDVVVVLVVVVVTGTTVVVEVTTVDATVVTETTVVVGRGRPRRQLQAWLAMVFATFARALGVGGTARLSNRARFWTTGGAEYEVVL